jgi:hypothetical protein
VHGGAHIQYVFISTSWMAGLALYPMYTCIKMIRVTTSRGRILRRRRRHWRVSHHFLVPSPSRNRSIDFNFQFPPFLDSSIFKEVVCLEDSKTLSLFRPFIHPSISASPTFFSIFSSQFHYFYFVCVCVFIDHSLSDSFRAEFTHWPLTRRRWTRHTTPAHFPPSCWHTPSSD